MTIGAQLAAAQSSLPTVLAAMKTAGDSAGSAVKDYPAVGDFMSTAMTYAGNLSAAVHRVASAANASNALRASESAIDADALKAGIAELRAALPMRELSGELERLLNDPKLIAMLKQRFGDEKFDSAVVRGALKTVKPSSVTGFQGLHDALTKLEASEHVAQEAQLKSSLGQMRTDLKSILDDFGKDLDHLVGICDKWVASLQ
jgi:hypothetical protein